MRPGVPRQALYLACKRDVPVLSQEVWREFVDVLHRPRLAWFIDPSDRDEVIRLLQSLATWIEPVLRVSDCRDAKDNKYLELALASGASTIVSGDAELLILHPWRGVQILRPADYLASTDGAAD